MITYRAGGWPPGSFPRYRMKRTVAETPAAERERARPGVSTTGHAARSRGSLPETLLAFARLSRLDAPVIAFLSFLVGARLCGSDISARHVLTATLLAVVSTNFIYACNAVYDWREDVVSHPRRPIPAGVLGEGEARAYALVLLVLAVAYPALITTASVPLALFWLLPLLGVIYSAPPARLRRFPVLAVMIICVGLVTPMALAIVLEGGWRRGTPIVACLLLFCLSVVPLKAVEEESEALTLGLRNLYVRFGRRIFAWAGAGVLITAFTAGVLLAGHVRTFLLLMCLVSLLVIGFFARLARPEGVYRAIIRAVVAAGAVYFLALQFLR